MISVIVPVYKVEKYLDRCVLSIVNQTYKNLEIILVDDGSPDACPAMCDRWAEKDSRIKVVHKKNGGLSDARNAGMAVARGDYIGFVDGDDYIRCDMYERMLCNSEENGSDIACCGVKMVWDNGNERIMTPKYSYILDNIEAVKAVVGDTFIKQVVWNRLYKREIIEGLHFPVGKYHEDVFWSYKAVSRALKVSVFDTPCYFYIQRDESIMSESYSEKRFDVIEACVERCSFIAENYPSIKPLADLRLLLTCMYHTQLLLSSKMKRKIKWLKKIHKCAESIGGDWLQSEGLTLKQKRWNKMYIRFPFTVSLIRNILKIGL